MRLICPNCDAQYEVDAGAIPDTGRDVQCSNCGHAWFQVRDVIADDLSDDLYREPEPEQVAEVPAALAQTDAKEYEDEDPPPPPPIARPAPVQRVLDPSVLAILREEAAHEMAARKAEAAGLEMQGDLGLPPPISPVVGSAAAAAAESASAQTQTDERISATQGEPRDPPRVAARRDLLPDIEEINSSLRPNDASVARGTAVVSTDSPAGSGFRSGFVLVLILAAIGIAVYVMAPQISAQIPGAADALASYVTFVDALRQGLDGLMQRATGALNGLTGR
jgi:predicted Zn finger-like uncharacterized protein